MPMKFILRIGKFLLHNSRWTIPISSVSSVCSLASCHSSFHNGLADEIPPIHTTFLILITRPSIIWWMERWMKLWIKSIYKPLFPVQICDSNSFVSKQANLLYSECFLNVFSCMFVLHSIWCSCELSLEYLLLIRAKQFITDKIICGWFSARLATINYTFEWFYPAFYFQVHGLTTHWTDLYLRYSNFTSELHSKWFFCFHVRLGLTALTVTFQINDIFELSVG